MAYVVCVIGNTQELHYNYIEQSRYSINDSYCLRGAVQMALYVDIYVFLSLCLRVTHSSTIECMLSGCCIHLSESHLSKRLICLLHKSCIISVKLV